MKTFQAKLINEQGKEIGTYRASFTPLQVKTDNPIVTPSIYGVVLQWDFKTMKVTWWFRGNPDNKNVTELCPC